MAATYYLAAFTSANTPTWARADIANERHGFSATGWTASGSTTTSVPTTGTGGDVSVGITLSGLTAGTAYKVWLIWDDGTSTSNTGSPVGSAEFYTGTDVSLTGQSVATSAGTITATVTYALTGAEVTVSAGDVTETLAYGLTGAEVTVSGGDIAETVSYALTGSEVATAAGTITAEGGDVSADVTKALTGESVATTAGTLLSAITTALTSSESTVSAGTVVSTPTHGLTGAEVTVSAGTLEETLSIELQVSPVTTVAGTITQEGGDSVAPEPSAPTGGGKSKKPRKRRYQVEVDGEVFDVDSLQEAEAVLADVAKKAEETASLAVERAAKAKRRPVRKIMHDAQKALQTPEIAVPPDLRDLANQIIGRIQSQYKSALSSIEISAQIAKREREIEEDDEEVLMLL